MAELPDRLAQILEEYQRGQTSINFDMHASDELARLLTQAGEKYRHGLMGYGTSNQLKHSVYHRYDT